MIYTLIPTIKRLGSVKNSSLCDLYSWCGSIKHLMFNSISTYAPGRLELHIRHFVKLQSSKSNNKPEIKPVNPNMCAGLDRIEKLGETILPKFDHGLVLFYPKGTQILPHRDAAVYAKGAAQVNVQGDAIFLISEYQDMKRMDKYLLKQGDCITFDNKQPHGIAPVEEDRWCICFFRLKDEYMGRESSEQDLGHKQLSLL